MTKGERKRKDALALATPPMWAVIPRCREAGPATHLCHRVMLHAQNVLHQMVGLADELHVTILYPIMHHLHEVSCSLLSHLSVTNTKRPSEPTSDSSARRPPHTENNKCEANIYSILKIRTTI